MYIAVGNHGIGKTTFLSQLAEQESDIHVAQDIHDEESWKHLKETLQKHVKDMADNDVCYWTLEKELTRLKCYANYDDAADVEGASVVTKHSIHIQRYVFAHNAYLQGRMSDIEWNVYEHTYDEFSKRHAVPEGIIYLYTEPDIIFEHLPDDQRFDMTRDYMTQIHNQYESFLMRSLHEVPALYRVPVIMIDYNKAVQGDKEAMHNAVYEASRFIAVTNRCYDENTKKASVI